MTLTEVLKGFLPRFNQRFRVPPQHTETAYRVLDPQMCLGTTLCLKYAAAEYVCT